MPRLPQVNLFKDARVNPNISEQVIAKSKLKPSFMMSHITKVISTV